MAYCGPRGIPLSEFLRWDRTDQDAALAWSAHENRRCGNCGTHPDEWAEEQFPYHAHLTECRGCKQLQRLSNTDEAKSGDGRYSVMAPGGAAECAHCRPLEVIDLSASH
jgi:hypothetical protein